MPAGYRPVDSQIYVFSNNSGYKNHPQCMLTAHGEQVVFGNSRNRKFTLAHPQNIHFYAPHGHVLETTFSSIGIGARRIGHAAESLTNGNQCYEYNLSKFEGYHTNGATGFTPLDKLIDCCWAGQRGLSYNDLLNLVATPEVDVDVVTIRYRVLKREMTLSRCLNQLWNAGYNYTDVHCSFCRNSVWQSFKSAVVDVPTTRV